MPTCVDLFCGGGGLTLGMKAAGWTPLFGIDRDSMSLDTYSANFLSDQSPYCDGDSWPDWLPKRQHDVVRLLTDSEMRERFSSTHVDALIGGPPCQGFSVG